MEQIDKSKARESIPDLTKHLDELNDDSFIENGSEFLCGEDEPLEYNIAEIGPKGTIVLFHGGPRSMKSTAAAEFCISAVTERPAFGLQRLVPSGKLKVLYLSQEDGRKPIKKRFRAILAGHGIDSIPEGLAFAVHKGISLDVETWCERLIRAIKKNGYNIVVFDPIRRFSSKTDKGPADVRDLTGYLRKVITETEVTIIVVHHDKQPLAQGEDSRRRGYRASGGDWFAASDCPIHFEKVSKNRSLVICEDFKFSTDPAPFTFEFTADHPQNPTIIKLTGKEETETEAASLVLEEKILEYLFDHPSSSTNGIVKYARARRENVQSVLERMLESGKVDSAPGKRNAVNWFLKNEVGL